MTEHAAVSTAIIANSGALTLVLPRARRQLVETAEVERRVILTCDRAFVRARHSDFTYFVRAERKQEQLEEVVLTVIAWAHICSGFRPRRGQRAWY